MEGDRGRSVPGDFGGEGEWDLFLCEDYADFAGVKGASCGYEGSVGHCT